MTATSHDVLTFKAKIAEFADTPDADVAAALDEADMWLDAKMWNPNDFPWARWWLAAHGLKLDQTYATSVAASGSSSSAAVGMFVRSIGFGERRVMFGERKFETSKSGISGPGQELLEETVYGNKFLRLRARNIPAIITV
jgi:hypothetical protein